MTTPEGNMNPRFTEVDIEPDEDLNTKLKFFVSSQLALMAGGSLKERGLLLFATFLFALNLFVDATVAFLRETFRFIFLHARFY